MVSAIFFCAKNDTFTDAVVVFSARAAAMPGDFPVDK